MYIKKFLRSPSVPDALSVVPSLHTDLWWPLINGVPGFRHRQAYSVDGIGDSGVL